MALGVTQAVQTNQGEVLDLPQDYADMLGWSGLAEATAAVWNRLTPAEQTEGIVAAGNYGQAGALAMYHRKLGFPYPVSAAGDFHAWGLGNRTGQVAVIVDGPSAREGLERLFEEVEEAGRVEEPWAVPGERDRRIFVARRPRRPLAEVWPTLGPRWC